MRKRVLELQIGYIADSIIEVKRKRFNDEFTTLDEVNIVKQLMEKKFEINSLNVKIVDVFLKKYFNNVNGVITKSNKLLGNLKENISNIEVRKIVYDENFVYLCLCEILINKLNNSIEHNCLNCSTECCGMVKTSSEDDCCRWSYNFKVETQKALRKIL